MKKTLLFLFGIIGFAVTHAQPINVNTTTYTVPQLVTDVLFGDGTSSTSCAGAVSNITWSTGTNFGQANGIGYFTNTNPAFPMSSGVILSTGSVSNAPGPNGSTQSGGNWPGDTDLFNYIQGLGIDPNLNDYNDATILEFDFTPLTSNMSFDFLFASEEYGTFQCDFSDAFAFFLTDVTAATPTTNLALVPSTTTPISVITIRDDANNGSCGDSFPQYFGTFDPGSGASTPTNFNGTTVMMTAGSAVIPGHTYHIKLVIADRNDNMLDSGVFLGGGSFDIGQANIEGTGQYAGLSTDYLIADGTALCPQQTITLQAGPAAAANATYSWALNTFPIPGANQFSLTVSAPGTYSVTATYGPTCSQTDDIVVEYLPTPAFGTPINLTSTSTFDLTQNTPIILNGLSGYSVTYHHTLFDAQNIANPILNPTTYPGVDGEQIFASVEDTNTGCIFVVSFLLSTDSLATTPPDMVVCDDASNNGTATFNLTTQTPIVLGAQPAADYTITYHLTQANADNDASPISPANAFVNTTNPQTIYVRMENNADPTSFSTVSFDLIINPQPAAPVVSNVSACNDVGYTLPALPAGSTYHSVSGGTAASLIPAGTIYNTPNTTTTVYVFAQSNTTPNCSAESSFTITINPRPATPAPSNVAACSDIGYALPALPAGSTYHSASGGAAATLIPVGTMYNTPNTTSTVYVFAESGTVPNCTAEASFTITINQKPITPNPSDVFACSDIGFTLPALPAGSTYHSASGGASSTIIPAGTVYNTPNTTTTLYVFAESGTIPNCTAEGDFVITIYAKPATPNPTDVSACSDLGYSLPALPLGSTYHSAPGGSAATAIPAGTLYNTPNTTTTIYIFAQSGTTPNCTAEGDFAVTINPTPATPNPSNVTVCDSYALPALPPGQSYHTASGGAASTLITLPATITTTQTIWIFAQTGTTPNCTAEGDFLVTVNQTPATPNPSDVTACDSYVLPALAPGQTYHDTTVGGPVIAPLTSITATKTIWIVAETGTSPNCSSSGDFVVTINNTPPAPTPSNVTVCDSYVLPALPAGQTYHDTTVTGPVIAPLTAITATRTIWIVAETGTSPNCSSSASFVVTVNPTPVAEDPADVVACDSYALPPLNIGHYYSAPGGGGTLLDGATITTTQTVYVYAQSGTSPNCSSQNDFLVSIFYSPVINTPSDYHVCDDNNDGFSCLFNLSGKNSEVTSNAALTVSYHETLTDAQNGVNAVSASGYCNIVSLHQTLYVRVFDPAAPLCYSVTTLELYVDPVPVANPSIDDYRLCDVNNPGDLTEGFTLSLWDAEVLNGQGGVTVSYYDNQADALSGTNPINASVPYNNTASPQQIWVRLLNPASGCFGTGSFRLYVDPLPAVSAPLSLNECGSAAGFAQFDLDAHSLDISGVPGTSVSYHLTQAEALAGTGALASPYTNISNPQVLYASVKESAHGCVNTTTVTLNVSTGPVVNTPTMLQVCDPNNDGYAQFDLTQSYIDVVGSNPPPAGITVTFHETMTDAQNGVTPVSTAYFNINPGDQTIYVRATYDATGCYSIVPLALHVNPTPQIAENVGPKHVCDDDTDGIGTFNLTLYTAELMGGLDPALYTLSYHLSQADAQANAAAITNLLGFHNDIPATQTIWVRLQDNASGCFDVMPLVLVVDPKPTLPPTPTGAVSPYTLCDVNNPGDEKEVFDLSTKIPEIQNGQTGVSVHFYASLADAQGQANELSNLYTNIANAQTIHVRMENTAGCVVFTTMDLRVEPLPVLIPPPGGPVTVCDPDGDGFGLFDLQSLVAGMLQGAPDITVSFHETLADAQGGTNAIALNPYPNITPFVQVIYVRAVNTLTGCENTMALELNVIASPVVPNPLGELRTCDSDASNQDGHTLFNLTQNQAQILAAQSGPASSYTITYHLTQGDAQSGAGPIFPATAYTNTTNPQTIWVRVSGGGSQGCFNIGSFDLRVDTPLALATPSQLTICDDGPTSAVPQAVFDLTVKNNEITGGAAGYTVSYYQTQADALAGVNAISDPQAYTNNPNPQTLFVAVSGPSPQDCRSYTTLTIRVLPLPVPQTLAIPPLEMCDDTAPAGSEPFDLTQNEDYIRDNDPGLIFEYYTSEADANTRTNPISPPTAYQGQSGYVWIRVMRSTEANSLGEFCYVVVRQELILHPLPVVAPATLVACDPAASNTSVFTLADANPDVLDADPSQAVSDFSFAYYLTLADAQGQVNPLPGQYTNTANPQDITVVVTNIATGCRSYAVVTLSVKAGAVTSAATDYASCDSDPATPNGVMTLTLSQLFDTQVLGTQPAAGFTVGYFASVADAAAGTNQLPDSYGASSGVIYAVVTNTATGCRSDERAINILIEPLAEPVITNTSNSICVDFDGTLESGLTLTSNLSADPAYTLQWFYGGNVVGTGATYTISDPLGFGDYTLVATSTSALGCVSQPSAVFTVVQSGQAHIPAGTTGYLVSEYFQDAQTITVNIEGNGAGFYQYQLDDGPIVDNGGVFTNVGPRPDGQPHIVRVYDFKGTGNDHCDPLEIGGIRLVDYPHYFTPNGDGVHDTWMIQGLEDSAKIYIFDRYGKLIKQIAPNGQGWDGTYNGQPLPSTDYWFTVEYDEPNATTTVNKEFKAHFSLKR